MVAVLGPQLPDAIGPGGGSSDRTRDVRFEEAMPQDAMRREAAMWSTRLKSQTSRSNPGAIQEDSVLSPSALALFALHEAIFRNTTSARLTRWIETN